MRRASRYSGPILQTSQSKGSPIWQKREKPSATRASCKDALAHAHWPRLTTARANRPRHAE
eukprot:7898427-Pyramimonas_sp.AAC.1